MPEVASGLADVLPGDPGEESGSPEDRQTADATADPAAPTALAGEAGAADGPAAATESTDLPDWLLDGLAGADLSALYDGAFGYALEYAGALARSVLNAATALITGLVVVIFLVLLMLVEREAWQAKAHTIFTRSSQAGWNDTFAMTARSFRWFILVRTGLGVATAALYAGWLAIFGVELLLVWFVLAFLLNYIPIVGAIIAGVLPALYVFATQDWETALIVAAGLLVIEQVMGNYVDSRVQGRQLSVSPTVAFFALLLFGWMWGIVGALLATPIVVFAVIALAHIERLKPVALLLSDARDMKGLEEKTYL